MVVYNSGVVSGVGNCSGLKIVVYSSFDGRGGEN